MMAHVVIIVYFMFEVFYFSDAIMLQIESPCRPIHPPVVLSPIPEFHSGMRVVGVVLLVRTNTEVAAMALILTLTCLYPAKRRWTAESKIKSV